LIVDDPEEAVAASARMRRAGLPKLSLNRMYHTNEAAVAPPSPYGTDIKSRTYAPVKKVQTANTNDYILRYAPMTKACNTITTT
jgi:hypothetical protein